jgi:hypothetical protein
MNFGYLWWLLYLLILSFFFARALKHRFYNPINVFTEFKNGFKWLILILVNIFTPLLSTILSNANRLTNQIIVRYYQSSICSTLINSNKLEINYIISSFKLIKNINNTIIFIFNKII